MTPQLLCHYLQWFFTAPWIRNSSLQERCPQRLQKPQGGKKPPKRADRCICPLCMGLDEFLEHGEWYCSPKLEFSDEYVGLQCKLQQVPLVEGLWKKRSAIHGHTAVFTGHPSRATRVVSKWLGPNDYRFRCPICNNHLQALGTYLRA